MRQPIPPGFMHAALPPIAETTDLFGLNIKLSIPFDGWSEMEIDLYCAELKLVIEIDGPQHLSDPAAYRSDRRKDAPRQGKRLPCPALPRRRSRQTFGCHSRCHPPRDNALATEAPWIGFGVILLPIFDNPNSEGNAPNLTHPRICVWSMHGHEDHLH
jgi:hypothetical protein